jgi:hypothetical protein
MEKGSKSEALVKKHGRLTPKTRRREEKEGEKCLIIGRIILPYDHGTKLGPQAKECI